MLKTWALLSLLSVLASLAALANQLLIANFFGAGAELDGYLMAVNAPLLVTGTATAIISHCFVPALTRQRRCRESSRRFNTALLVSSLGAAAMLAASAYVAAPGLMGRLAGHLPEDLRRATVGLARTCWAAAAASLVVSSLSALHHSGKRFLGPAVAALGPYLGMIAVLGLGPRQYGTALLAWGMLAGYVLAGLALLAGAAGDVAPSWPGRAAFRQVGAACVSLPLVVLASLAFSAFGTVDSIVAARLGPGVLSSLGYAQRIVIALGNLVVLGPSVMLVPYVAESLAHGDDRQVRQYTQKSLLAVLALSAPLAVGAGLLRVPLLEVCFQRGAFDAASTLQVAATLPWMLAGAVPTLGCVVAFRVLYGRRRYRAAAALGVLVVALYSGLSYGLSRIWGLQGVCLAYAATWWITLAGAVNVLRERPSERWFQAPFWNYAARYAGGLLAGGLLVWGARQWWIRPVAEVGRAGLTWRLGATAAAGAAACLFLGALLFPRQMVPAWLKVRWTAGRQGGLCGERHKLA